MDPLLMPQFDAAHVEIGGIPQVTESGLSCRRLVGIINSILLLSEYISDSLIIWYGHINVL